MSDSWPNVALDDVCERITDGTHHSPTNLPTGVYRYVTAKNIRPWGLDLSDISYVDEETHREIYARCPVEQGDVLYIKDGVTTGLAVVNPLSEPFSMLSSVALLKPKREMLEPSYLKHWLNSPITVAQMTSEMTGTAIKRLVLRQIRAARIPLPSIGQQRSIANKLDSLLVKIDASRERLDRVPQTLKKLREAVLEAAVSGRLTEEWRQRVRAPQEWQTRSVNDVAEVVRGASPRPAGDFRYFGGDIPWITVGELTKDDNKYLTKVSTFLTVAGKARSRFVTPRTLLLSNSGATLGVPKIIKIGGCINDGSVALLGVDEPLKSYLYYVLKSKTQSLRRLNQGAAQPNLNTTIVKAIEFSMPPTPEEQTEVVRRVEELFALADGLKRRYQEAVVRVEKLTPSVLAKAFRGELVPQDLKDEPAGEMLERIRKGNGSAEVTARSQVKSIRRKAGRTVIQGGRRSRATPV